MKSEEMKQKNASSENVVHPQRVLFPTTICLLH